ncbi:unnamed protein product [Clonostachys chloroleuca]|uniref:Uncharacterized protein n=1 Tax=Clonostachys chloroleuca TaxID=1926264 RepID=A0AA35MBH3_9HYPO|nr:unnamed protein product [Clonostachys chloroleuca]
MTACLCSTVSHLAKNFDEVKAKELVPQLNRHLAAIRSLLSKSKSLSRDVQYSVSPNNQRAMKIMSIQAIDMNPVNEVCKRFRNDLAGFWIPSDDAAHGELRRRLACISVFLRSRSEDQAPSPASVASFVQGHKLSDLRYAGKKYIKIARKLGGIGAVFCLPLDVPFSTHEDYTEIAQLLVSQSLTDSVAPYAYHNLFSEYPDILPDFSKLSLIIHALGDSGIPDVIFKSVRSPQRRWNPDGEIESNHSADSGISSEILQLLSDDDRLDHAATDPNLIRQTLNDGTVSWSISPEQSSLLASVLLPETVESLAVLGLKLICFACPPCYEGNTSWSSQVKQMVWSLLDKALERPKTAASLRCQVLDAILYFCERDSLAIRRRAVERARVLLVKSVPYYLHASVALFQSLLCRMDVDLVQSDFVIRDFLCKSRPPVSRRDDALRGRLHISHIENMIQRFDDDVASSIYEWQGTHPLSALEIDVTRRLQGLAAKFFQSIGDFEKSRDSLEQYLSLNPSEPITVRMRRPIVSRLTDTHCEIGDYHRAFKLIQPEIANIAEKEKRSRPVRRLLLASVEASIGQVRLDEAESTLLELAEAEAPGPDDLTDQLMHMRGVIARARVAHERLDFREAIRRWSFALEENARLEQFNQRYQFTAAVLHLSLAHAHLSAGDETSGRQSWDIAAGIVKTQRCEFWLPVVASQWLRKMVNSIHEMTGWPFRIMLPGRKPDLTWV